jgi:hypothetical protein
VKGKAYGARFPISLFALSGWLRYGDPAHAPGTTAFILALVEIGIGAVTGWPGVAADCLEQAGLHAQAAVELFERDQFPREKPCGEGLMPGAVYARRRS